MADWESAYVLAKPADARVPNSAEIAELWPRLSWRVRIPSAPASAIVYRQAFDAQDDQWEELGRTPLENIRFPDGLSRLRFELEGHRPVVRALGGAHVNWEELRGEKRLLDTLPVSNFNGSGLWRVTGSRAMSHVGAYDVTGNVREWTASTLADERIILGGSWNEAYYIAGVRDTSASPLDRSASRQG